VYTVHRPRMYVRVCMGTRARGCEQMNARMAVLVFSDRKRFVVALWKYYSQPITNKHYITADGKRSKCVSIPFRKRPRHTDTQNENVRTMMVAEGALCQNSETNFKKWFARIRIHLSDVLPFLLPGNELVCFGSR